MVLGDIYISGLKIMNDNIGGDKLSVGTLVYHADDAQYADRLENMREVVNRGLLRAGSGAYIDGDADYATPISTLGISKELAILLPWYIKYELYQDDNIQQAMYAIQEYDRQIAKLHPVQDKIVNVFGVIE